MKMKLFVIIIAFLCATIASAQNYSIRVAYNTNLRAGSSLQAGVVASAPAGTTLRVTGSHGRWLQIDWHGGRVWMADWVNHSRVDDAPQPPAPAQTPVDNCCFVDRQCHSEKDWADGYWAYQNNQCGGAPPSSSATAAQPASSSPAQIDNCCFAGWQCHSEKDWADGYWAYQNGQCEGAAPAQPGRSPGDAPATVDNCCWVNRVCSTQEDWDQGWAAYKYYACSTDIPMTIKGSSNFVALTRAGFQLLKDKAPRWYAHGISGLRLIAMEAPDAGIGFYPHNLSMGYGYDGDKTPSEYDIVEMAGSIAHEACHGHAWINNTQTDGWRNELPCMQAELAVYRKVDPQDRFGFIAWAQHIVDNIRDPAIWWW